jgi:hypothetical protein
MSSPEAYTRGNAEHHWRATIERIRVAAVAVGAGDDFHDEGSHVYVHGRPEKLQELLLLLPRSVAIAAIGYVTDRVLQWERGALDVPAR